MKRGDFARQIAKLDLSHADRAIAFLWFYTETQQFEERTARELADDLADERFPAPNVTRLSEALKGSVYTVRGKRRDSFALDLRQKDQLDQKYSEMLGVPIVNVSDAVLPKELLAGSSVFFERMSHQINGCYDNGFYDACAVLCRRVVESLLIQVYLSAGRGAEIRDGGRFVYLEQLINKISTDPNLQLSRNMPTALTNVKRMGDTAAHDRNYLTLKQDIDDRKPELRAVIQELSVLAKLRK